MFEQDWRHSLSFSIDLLELEIEPINLREHEYIKTVYKCTIVLKA